MIKSIANDKLRTSLSVTRQLRSDQHWRVVLNQNFQLLGREAPVAKLLVSAVEMRNPQMPANGVDIWERCYDVDATDPALWLWVSDLLRESVRFGLEHGGELVSSFRPANIMQNADDQFVIVNAFRKIGGNTRWEKQIASYIENWCTYCQKTKKELTESWPVEYIKALNIQADEIPDYHPNVDCTPVAPSLLFHNYYQDLPPADQ